MKFNIYAGNMYCGTLTVTGDGAHCFYNREDIQLPVARITGYKQLRLVREV